MVWVARPSPSRVSRANLVEPSSSSTEPVGTAAPAVTSTVNVTGSPPTVELSDEVRVTVVADASTTWLTGADVLVARPPSGTYTAVSGCVPAVSVLVSHADCPPLPSVSETEPIVVGPSRNCTVPVGSPGSTAVTVTRSTTVWPTDDGFGEVVRTVVVAGSSS